MATASHAVSIGSTADRLKDASLLKGMRPCGVLSEMA
jgi:hypothetical protein